MLAWRALALFALGLSALTAGGMADRALAQENAASALPVLVLDQDRLFVESRFGKAVLARHQAAQQALQEENRGIARQLEAEERDLTDRRASLAPAEFQKLAAEFDRKAEEIRMTQAAKSDEITRQLDAERQRFARAAGPVLQALREDTGASLLIDRRVVLFAAPQVDVTEAAIRRLDEVLGEGPPAPAEASGPAEAGSAPAEP